MPDCEIPSDHAIVSWVRNVATQHGVRHLIWGYNTRTETHLPKAWSQGHFDWRFIKSVHRRFGSGRVRTFPHLTFTADLPVDPYYSSQVNLLDYVDYVKADAIAILERQVGWRSYGGKHHENIYTRWWLVSAQRPATNASRTCRAYPFWSSHAGACPARVAEPPYDVERSADTEA